jgi:hypothetical protein
MGRKHTAGTAGGSGVGGFNIDNTTLTAADDLDITIDPAGTGIFKVAGDAQIQAQGDLRFADSDSSNWVAFQAPATIASNITWTLPATDGSSGQLFSTNGSGTISWATAGVNLVDNTSDAATHFVTLTTATTDGSITGIRRSSSKLTFQPSTGTLSITELRVAGLATSLEVENVQSSSYTCVLADAGKIVTMDNTSSATITIPPNSSVAYPVGTVISIARINSGSVALTAGGGVTLTGNTASGAMYASEQLYCRKRSTDTWFVVHAPIAAVSSASGGSTSTSGGYKQHQYTSAGGYSFVVSS